MSREEMLQKVIHPDIVAHIDEYAKNGKPGGGFLRAVYQGDLFRATNLADPQNRAVLAEISEYVQHVVPSFARGSLMAVAAWERKHGH